MTSKIINLNNTGFSLHVFTHYFIVIKNESPEKCYVIFSNKFKNCLILSGVCFIRILFGKIVINRVKYSTGYEGDIFSLSSHTKFSLYVSNKPEDFSNESNNDLINLSIEAIKTELGINLCETGFACAELVSNPHPVIYKDITQLKEYRKIVTLDESFVNYQELNFSLTEKTDKPFYLTKEMDMKFNEIFIQNLMGKSLLFAGTKNVGKSTMARYFLNKILGELSYDELYVLDLDPGQTEFFCNGSLSLVKVTKPLMGPPFTHMLTNSIEIIDKVLIGSCSPRSDSRLYFKSCAYLLEKYYAVTNPENRAPLLINTMGWTRDLGELFMMFILKLINPSYIIQMNRGKSNLDFIDLNQENVENFCRSNQAVMSRLQPRPFTSELVKIVIDKQFHTFVDLSLRPSDFRHLMTIIYIFTRKAEYVEYIKDDILVPPSFYTKPSLRLRHQVPVRVQAIHKYQKYNYDRTDINWIPQVKLFMPKSDDEITEVKELVKIFNCQFVGVCNYSRYVSDAVDRCKLPKMKETDLMPCIGMVFVRNINLEKRELLLSTDLSPDQIHGRFLFKGENFTPDNLLLNQLDPKNTPNFCLPFISPHISAGIGNHPMNSHRSFPKIRRLR